MVARTGGNVLTVCDFTWWENHRHCRRHTTTDPGWAELVSMWSQCVITNGCRRGAAACQTTTSYDSKVRISLGAAIKSVTAKTGRGRWLVSVCSWLIKLPHDCRRCENLGGGRRQCRLNPRWTGRVCKQQPIGCKSSCHMQVTLQDVISAGSCECH